MPDRQLNAGRKRRLLARLDAALAAAGVKRKASKPKPAADSERRRMTAAAESKASRRSYAELRSAIRALGGIRPNRDYKASEIPRELRARAGRGLAPDEMAANLQVYGFHYEGDSALFSDVERRRATGQSAREGGRRRKNPSTVCSDLKRNSRGQFVKAR